jgi:hypothetical protein
VDGSSERQRRGLLGGRVGRFDDECGRVDEQQKKVSESGVNAVRGSAHGERAGDLVQRPVAKACRGLARANENELGQLVLAELWQLEECTGGDLVERDERRAKLDAEGVSILAQASR